MKLKSLMAEKLMTATALGELSGVSRQTISCVLNGKSCGLMTAAKIAQAFNVPLETIAEE
jgi:putative transcriptional regulator